VRVSAYRAAQDAAHPGSWRVYADPAVLRMLVLGFSAALPYVMIYGTLSYRLREAGISLKQIGFWSWVVLVYPFKWVWSPVLDRVAIPGLTRLLGRRRSWLLVSQATAMTGLLLMALLDPQQHLAWLVACTLFTAVGGATQDIALDAYRIESARVEQQAAMAAMYQSGYRIGMIWAGAGALWLTARAAGGDNAYHAAAWTVSYAAMAASMLVGMTAAALAPEERPAAAGAAGSAAAPTRPADLLAPFLDFGRRFGWYGLILLALISSYRLANITMGVMANPFYHDLGFTKDQVAAVSKIYGVVMALAGGFVGGVLTIRVGLARMMWAAALVSSASILLYAWLATRGADIGVLILAISVDNFSEGIAGTVFIAFLSALANREFSATQYALLSSATTLASKFVAGFSGVAVEALGYPVFFCLCAASGSLPLVLVWATQRWVPGQSFSKR
jgi:PAT family beta-lactamase induction signal transducer AmpG